MKSALLQKKQKNLIEVSRHMTPEERLTAFLNHSQLMVQMRLSGKKYFTETHPFQKNYES